MNMMRSAALRDRFRGSVRVARYTATVRDWRFTSLVVALAFAFSPVALDVCQAMCTHPADVVVAADDHEQHAAKTSATTNAHAHSHHATDSGPGVAQHIAHTPAAATAIAGKSIQGAPHVCAHAGDLASFLAPTLQVVLASPAVQSQLFAFAHTSDDAGPPVTDDPCSVQPAQIIRTTRLRI
jgi:hypothetical protein